MTDQADEIAAIAGEREAVLSFMRDAISQGYPVNKSDVRAQCAHDKFYWEECIACYDDFLESKLVEIECGNHLKGSS